MTSIIVLGLLIDFLGAFVIALSESPAGVSSFTFLSAQVDGELGNLERGLRNLTDFPVGHVPEEHEELVPEDTDEVLVTQLREGDQGFQEIKSAIRKFRPHSNIPFYIDAIVVVSTWDSKGWEVKPYEGKWTGNFDKRTRRGYKIRKERRKKKNYPTHVYLEGEHYGQHAKESVATFEKLKEWINSYRKSKIRRWGLLLLLSGFAIQIVGYIFF